MEKLTNEDLDAALKDVQARRAAAEEAFKAEAKELKAEMDRRALAAQVAAVPDEVIAAIRAAKPAKEG